MNPDKYNWYMTSSWFHVNPPSFVQKYMDEYRSSRVQYMTKMRAKQKQTRKNYAYGIKYTIKRKLGLF